VTARIHRRKYELTESYEMEEERMMIWFHFNHLEEKLQVKVRNFYSLADIISQTIEPGPERTVALRKLLEAKDAAVRATLHPGR